MPKRKAGEHTSASDEDEPFLFVTSRKVNDEFDNPKGRELEGYIISQVLSNLLTDDAIDSYEEDERMETDNLRIGWARNATKKKPAYKSKTWKCDILEDAPPGDGSIVDTPQAREAFHDLARRATSNNRPILLLVHGYNNDVTTPLQAASILREKHDCEIILFMWPTEGRIINYDLDRMDAEITARPFLRFLRKTSTFLDMRNRPKITLMCHSMGNYVLQQAVQSTPVDDDEGVNRYLQEGKDVLCSTPAFLNNIILTAADVNSHDHVLWVEKLRPSDKVFVCINRGDKVLAMSDMVAGRIFNARSLLGRIFFLGTDHPPRLGHTLVDINPTDTRVYVDIKVTWDGGLNLFQLLEFEHAYHYEGLEKIADFYKDAIHGSWNTQKPYQEELKDSRERQYYHVVGPSDDRIRLS